MGLFGFRRIHNPDFIRRFEKGNIFLLLCNALCFEVFRFSCGVFHGYHNHAQR